MSKVGIVFAYTLFYRRPSQRRPYGFFRELHLADWLGVVFQACNHFGSKFILLKMLKTSLVLFLRLTLQCWPVIALTSFFKRARAAFLTLCTFLGLDIFFFLFQFFSCSIVGLTQITLLLAITSTVIFVCFLLTIFNNFLLILYLLTY